MSKFRNVAAMLWADDAGFIVSSELLLIGTIGVLGLIVGLTAVRDSVVQELGDYAAAVGMLDQTYTYDGVTKAGGTQSTNGSAFNDESDQCDAADTTGGASGNGVDVDATTPDGATANE